MLMKIFVKGRGSSGAGIYILDWPKVPNQPFGQPNTERERESKNISGDQGLVGGGVGWLNGEDF